MDVLDEIEARTFALRKIGKLARKYGDVAYALSGIGPRGQFEYTVWAGGLEWSGLTDERGIGDWVHAIAGLMLETAGLATVEVFEIDRKLTVYYAYASVQGSLQFYQERSLN